MKKSVILILLFLLSILPWLAAAKILLIAYPPVWPDEPVLSQTALNLIKTGEIATGIYGGAIKGMEEHAFWYPPLYFHILAVWIRLFGQDMIMLRLFSVFTGLASLLVFFILLRQIFRSLRLSLLGAFLLGVDVPFIKASHILRMEILVFLFGLFSLLLFQHHLVSGKRLYLFLSGLILGLALLIHPMASISLALIVLILLFKKSTLPKKIKDLSLLLIPVIILQFFWFISIVKNWDLFIYQMQLQFTRKSLLEPYLLRYFRQNIHWRFIFLTFLLIFIVLIAYFFLSRRKIFLIVAAGFIISVFSVLYGKDYWYFLYLGPFIIFGLVSLVRYRTPDHKNLFLLTILISLFAISNINLLYQENRSSLSGNYYSFSAKIAARIPSDSTVFLAAIPDPYFYLKSLNSYKLYEFPTSLVGSANYRNLLSKVDYLVINFLPGSALSLYMYLNKEKIMTVEEGDYSVLIVRLQPRERRI